MPLAGAFFIYPRVVAGSLTGSFDINQPDYDIYGRGEAYIQGASQAVITTALTPQKNQLTLGFADSPVLEIKALEQMPKSLITDEESFLAWHQMEANEGSDGDGRDARQEFLTGTDAGSPDDLRAVLISRDSFVIGM